MSFRLKDFIVPFVLALGFTIAFQYYFGERSTGTRSDLLVAGRSHVAPNDSQRPINREVDFIDAAKQEAVLTDVVTNYGKATFSTVGASLQQFEFIHTASDTTDKLVPINATGDENRCFLVALEDKTPLYYKLVSKEDNGDIVELTYRTEFDLGSITKKFIIFKGINKIDLEITAVPKADAFRLRLFYPAPHLDVLSTDSANGLYEEGAQNLQKKPADKVMDRYWENVTLFGAEDKYFINAMYKDENYFTQRSFYKKSPEGKLIAVLESNRIKEDKPFRLSFYVGPKRLPAILAVTDRLEKTLDYGFFSPLSKFLLNLLNIFYSYVQNYGWAILLLTLLIKLLLLPFSLKTEDDEKRREFERKQRLIEEKYKNNPQELNRAKADLIRTHGIPGMGGCIPNLLQLPIFIALNRVLSNSIDLYDAPFLWIADLAGPDPLYILPVLVGISIIAHSMTTANTDPKQKSTPIILGVVVGIISAGFPSGLVIFIFASSLLGALQVFFIKMLKKR